MNVRHEWRLSAAALLIAAPAYAGPCTTEIYNADLALGKKLDAAAAQGKPAAESTFATMHRQPTPNSVASAEEQAGDLSSAQVAAITQYMDEARKADDLGDRGACEKALGEARRILGP